MKLHQIRDLLAVAEKGSLRAAARQLGLAQPSISRSIGQLERELGVALLERQARGTVLTPAGKLFARRASAAASELRRGREEIEQLNEGAEGSITVGFSSVPLLTLLPAAVAPFKKRFARLELRIVDGAFPAIESRLKDGTVDFYAGVAPGKLELKEEMAAPPICLIRRAALPLTPAAEFLCDLLRRAGVQYARKSSGPSGRR